MSPVSAERYDVARMRWWHLGEVLRLDAELFGPTAWTAANFWAELAAPGRSYLIARETGPGDGRIIGFAGLAAGGPEAEVQTIAVSKRAQGGGLGRRLLNELIDGARRAAASSVLLEVRADNDRAAALYRSVGFERIGVRRGYYASVGVDALVMRLRLSPPAGSVPGRGGR